MKDPCDNCTRPWCYGCQYAEKDEEETSND